MFGLLKTAATIAVSLCLSVSCAFAQQFTLRIGSGTVDDTSQEWMRMFKAGVEARSGGRLKVETYVASALGSNPRMVEGVAMGTIEGALPNTGFFVSLEPRFLLFDAIGIFDGPEHATKVLHDAEIHKRVTSFGAEKGLETISVFFHSPLAITSHKPIRSIADFAGLKVRTPGGGALQTKPIEKLNASPISMPIMEALPALQNKAIDAVVTGSTVAATLKYYDVVKTLTHLPSSLIFVTAVINGGFMKRIGPELAAIVREEALKAEAPAVTWGIEDANRAREVWKRNGGENIDFTPADAKRFVEEVTSVAVPVLNQNPRVKADYEALLAAGQKYR